MAQNNFAAKCWGFTVQLTNVVHGQELALNIEGWNAEWTHALETKEIEYASWQVETCPTSGRLHGQLFVKFAKKIRKNQAYSFYLFTYPGVVEHPHCWKCVHMQESRDYSIKEESRFLGPWEFGVWTTMGARKDLDRVYDMVCAGATSQEILDSAPSSFIRYTRGISAAQLLVPPSLVNERRRIYLCYGEPGSGKSYFPRMVHKHGARDDAARIWIAAGSFGWFDGYIGQRVALLDEFSGARSGVKLADLLVWTDKYNVRVAVKCGFTWWTARYVWITTMHHPSDWYAWGGRATDWRALVRRFSAVFAWQSVDHGNYHVLTGDDMLEWFGATPGVNVAHVEAPNHVIDLTQ